MLKWCIEKEFFLNWSTRKATWEISKTNKCKQKFTECRNLSFQGTFRVILNLEVVESNYTGAKGKKSFQTLNSKSTNCAIRLLGTPPPSAPLTHGNGPRGPSELRSSCKHTAGGWGDFKRLSAQTHHGQSFPRYRRTIRQKHFNSYLMWRHQTGISHTH